ncbi:hypothetical protein, partial [Shinella sp. BYT-45]|uniref:hypothetical protein n=1 Tax=Shinella sp. BYT-45 TaxID=3377377 RepID=UPI0039804584
WSSPVARQAHNLKAAGSNPAPATSLIEQAPLETQRGFRVSILQILGGKNRKVDLLLLILALAAPTKNIRRRRRLPLTLFPFRIEPFSFNPFPWPIPLGLFAFWRLCVGPSNPYVHHLLRERGCDEAQGNFISSPRRPSIGGHAGRPRPAANGE